MFQGQRALSLGETPVQQGNNHPTIAPYGMFATAADPITIAVGNDKLWRTFCDVLGIPRSVADPRFRTGALRSANRDTLKQIVESALDTNSATEWVSTISRLGIPCGPIYDYRQPFGSTQVSALE